MSRYPWIYRSGNEGKWRMVRLPPWKLIHVPGRPAGENLLFHLASDPEELNDRAATRPDVVRRLETHLAEWLAEERGAAERAGPTLRPEDLENLRALGYAAPE
jgi:arylsulfatase A-like enzyme